MNRPHGDHSQWDELAALRYQSSQDFIRSHDSLELGNLVSGAHIPDVNTSCQISETSSEQELALGLVKDEVSMLGAERIDRFGFCVKELDSSWHI